MQRDDNIDRTSQLSSICSELRSTSQQRDQELHDISQLLEGIKQLQAAQQSKDPQSAEGREQWQLATAIAATGQQRQLDSALHTESAPSRQVESSIPDDLHAARNATSIINEQSTNAAPAAHALAAGNSWPQSTLLQLLDDANSSGSTKGNAVCPGSACSSSPGSSPVSRKPPAVPAPADVKQQQQAGATHAVSKFSFPETTAAQGLKYITPIKIPHNVRFRSARCSVIDSDKDGSSSPDSRSSGRGSYVGGFYTTHRPSNSPKIPAAAVASQGLSRSASGAAGFGHEPPASPVAQHAASKPQPNHSWQPSASTSPRLTSTSSMSSEAAALMLALRAAAQQREAARAVLQAKSSIASPTTRGQSPVDWDYMSDADDAAAGVKPAHMAEAAAPYHEQSAATQAARGAANPGHPVQSVGEQEDGGLGNQQGANRVENGENWLPRAQSVSPQPSVQGPCNRCSSSHSSILRSQRAAADQLMHEAVETSSMSSWMALLESQGATEDDDDQGELTAHAAEPAAEHVTAANAAQTWGSSCGSAPATDQSSCEGSDRGRDGTAGYMMQSNWVSETLADRAKGLVANKSLEQNVQPQQQYNQHGPDMHQHQMQQGRWQAGEGSELPAAAANLQQGHLLGELELLRQQVEAEKQQLADLQQQRHSLQRNIHNRKLAASTTAATQQAQTQTQQLSKGQRHPTLESGSVATGQQPVTAEIETQTEEAAVQAAASASTEPAASAVAVHDASNQTIDEFAAPRCCADAGCQAILLHVSGLPVVGPPPACRSCPLVQQQFQELQQRLQQAQEQHKQAQLSAERSHHQAMTAEAQLALSRQKLRAIVSANAKPLAMSGWEDLIEEAAADLERIEQHVATAAERLIELQAASASAAEALVTSTREAERQQAAATTAALRTEALQQEAEGLIAAISSNQNSKETTSKQLEVLQQQLIEQQTAMSAAEQVLKGLQEQVQVAKQQLAEADQQLAEKERGRQQIMSDLAEKQHQLQVTRGECASAQDRLSQLQTSLVEARQQLEDLQQQQRQQQRRHEETDRQLAALQAQRTTAAAEAAGAQQELSRVLSELDQCQKDIQAAELQQAELDEATAEKQRQLAGYDKAAAAAARKQTELETEMQQMQEQLKQMQQQAQAAKHEADLCTRAAAAADRQLLQVQQTLTALQSGTVNSRPAPTESSNTAAAAAAVTAQLAECAQLQVKLAAAESRRQLAEERQEEAERRVQQVKIEVNSLRDQRDAADRQLRQANAKCDKLKEKLREKCEGLAEVQAQLQQAQARLQEQLLESAAGKARERHQREADERTTAVNATAAAEAEAQQLLQSYQQRLKELELDITSARSQLQQAEQQLEQQRQTSSTLQQQLSLTQQQLVQAQQQLLDAPKQAVPGMLNHHQQADHVHKAVRSSIQGLQEALGLQTKLQQAQLEAETVKRQLQDVQAEKKQLQKKMVAYKQQLAETKSLQDQQQQQRRARSSVDHLRPSLPDPQVDLLRVRVEELTSELAIAQQQLTQTQQQLQWADRETEHGKQLLQQQQEICSQLRGELQRLEQQCLGQTVAGAGKVLVHAFTQADDQQEMVRVVADDAERVQLVQAELAMAKQQLMQAHAEYAAAKQEIGILQQQLESARQLQQQQSQQLHDVQQQLRQKESKLSQTATQLVQQQQEHKWQQVQWEQKLQAAEQQAGQELLECRAELTNRQAALKQLQGAAIVLEQQLVAAVKAAGQGVIGQDTSGADAGCDYDSFSQPSCSVPDSSSSNSLNEAHKLTRAVQLVKQLAAVCSGATEASQKLQQQLHHQQTDADLQLRQQQESHSSRVRQMMRAVEDREVRRQEAELLQLQLQQECQLLRLQLQQQQQDQQSHLPGHMQSMNSVLNVLQQLHAATERSIQASTTAGWCNSSCRVSLNSAAPPPGSAAAATAVANPSAGTATAYTTPASTPHMSLETLGGLPPPANCLSPQVPTAAAAGHSAAQAAPGHHNLVPSSPGNLKPAAVRGLQYISMSSFGPDNQAGNGPGRPDKHVADFNQRLAQIIQQVMTQSQNSVLPAPPDLQQTGAAAAVGGVGSSEPVGVHGDTELQKSWEWLQQQAASHDRLLHHMKQTWEQAAQLAQQCLSMQAAAAAEAQRSRNSGAQTDQQVHQHEQQIQTGDVSTPQSGSSQPTTTGSSSQPADVTLNAYVPTSLSSPSSSFLATAAGGNALLTVAQPLLSVAQQLQQDIATLVQLNKHLVDKAKKLCSSFRSGGRAVRVRALSLKLELQQCCSTEVTKDGQQMLSSSQPGSMDVPGAATAVGGADAVLPAVVAQSVVQHWDEVELLIGQLHKSCEALLLPPSAADDAEVKQAQQQKQQQGVGYCNGSSSRSSSPAKQAVRRCRKVLDGLQELVKLCSAVRQQQCVQKTSLVTAPAAAVLAPPQQKQQQGRGVDEYVQFGSTDSKERQTIKQRKSRQSLDIAHNRHQQQQPRQQHRPQQQSSYHLSSSISSCSSDAGLGELLAMVTSKMAAVEPVTSARPSVETRKDIVLRPLADTAKGAKEYNVSSNASGAKDRLSGTAAGTAVVTESTSSLGQVDVASSASIRRAERALLLERLKLLQQQQQKQQQK